MSLFFPVRFESRADLKFPSDLQRKRRYRRSRRSSISLRISYSNLFYLVLIFPFRIRPLRREPQEEEITDETRGELRSSPSFFPFPSFLSSQGLC